MRKNHTESVKGRQLTNKNCGSFTERTKKLKIAIINAIFEARNPVHLSRTSNRNFIWWNTNLSKISKETKTFNDTKKTGNLSPYEDSLPKYNKKIMQDKKGVVKNSVLETPKNAQGPM